MSAVILSRPQCVNSLTHLILSATADAQFRYNVVNILETPYNRHSQHLDREGMIWGVFCVYKPHRILKFNLPESPQYCTDYHCHRESTAIFLGLSNYALIEYFKVFSLYELITLLFSCGTCLTESFNNSSDDYGTSNGFVMILPWYVTFYKRFWVT